MSADPNLQSTTANIIASDAKLTIVHLLQGVSFRADIKNSYIINNPAHEWSAKISIKTWKLYLCKVDDESGISLQASIPLRGKRGKYRAFSYNLIGPQNCKTCSEILPNQESEKMPTYQFIESGIMIDELNDYYGKVYRVIRDVIDKSGIIKDYGFDQDMILDIMRNDYFSVCFNKQEQHIINLLSLF
jgi:hypothetical protein